MKDFEKIILNPENSINDAIFLLQSEAKRIVLVTDDNKKLLGTVTDGDIRRALINHISLDDDITKVMNANPLTSMHTDSFESIIRMLKNNNIFSIPILDDNDVVVGIETLHGLLGHHKYENPVFLMAGGFGKRLHPLTKEKPKPLLKVGDKPILETIIDQFKDAGFCNFYISTHYRADMIREYFGDGSSKGISIDYVHEETPLGTAGSLGMLPDNIKKLPIIIMNGDILTRVNFEYLLDFHSVQNNFATICVKKYDMQVPYGVIESNEFGVNSIMEKPLHSFFVNAGIYVLDSSVINDLDGSSYLDMPSLLNSQIENGSKIGVFPIHEYWIDIGQISQYNEAQNDITSFSNKQI